MQNMNDAEQERIKAAASLFGRKGGKAKGPRKARPREHYQRIAKLGARKKAALARARKAAAAQ